jgi:hypothetical protein
MEFTILKSLPFSSSIRWRRTQSKKIEPTAVMMLKTTDGSNEKSDWKHSTNESRSRKKSIAGEYRETYWERL